MKMRLVSASYVLLIVGLLTTAIWANDARFGFTACVLIAAAVPLFVIVENKF